MDVYYPIAEISLNKLLKRSLEAEDDCVSFSITFSGSITKYSFSNAVLGVWTSVMWSDGVSSMIAREFEDSAASIFLFGSTDVPMDKTPIILNPSLFNELSDDFRDPEDILVI
jgi:hypothetical protein